MEPDATLDDLATRWRDALASWAIPPRILDAAPESPWYQPPALFKAPNASGDSPPSPATQRALDLLGSGGSLLDVGCGGGRSSIPLAGAARDVHGVDANPAMLATFAADWERRSPATPLHTYEGDWPTIAGAVPRVDVVICHHVAYNVADIVPFLRALAEHADRGVVIELTGHHPMSPLNPLWKHFWDLDRPTEPSADLLVRIVETLGYEPTVERSRRPSRPAAKDGHDRADRVALVRRRLCLGAEHDEELAALLGDEPMESSDELVAISWTSTARREASSPARD
ncbi:MAG: class I SAM-dependent methyltransferase [Ilumatobacteraceae bacterium]